MSPRELMVFRACLMLRVFLPSGIGLDEGDKAAALCLAFSTGVEILDDEGEPKSSWSGFTTVIDLTFLGAKFALDQGRVRFISTDFSELVALAGHNKSAYDACLIIAAYNLERGLTPELANMLRNHLQKPSRPKKGASKMIVRDHVIHEAVYWICRTSNISPTRNSIHDNSGCDIVQQAMSMLPEFKTLGLPSYDGVRKIWDERVFSDFFKVKEERVNFPDRYQTKQDRRKN